MEVPPLKNMEYLEKRIYEELEELVKARLDDDEYQLIQSTARKNNGVTRDGATLHRRDSSIAPTAYLDIYVAKVEEEELSVREAAEKIFDVLMSNQDAGNLGNLINVRNPEAFFEWNNIRDKIVITLASESRNSELLELLPHRGFVEDIVITYKILLESAHDTGSIRVTNELIEQWAVSEQELYETALANSQRMAPANVEKVGEVILKLIEDRGGSAEEEFGVSRKQFLEMDAGNPMRIVSNPKKLYGASVIAYTDVLQRVADEYGTDVFVLPSSMHEVITVPYDEEDCGFTEMIPEVNSTQVPPEEVLSDYLYRYKRETGELVRVVRS